MEITTSRLLLRPWKESDLEPFARLNADAEVRRYFEGTLTRAESDASVGRYMARYDRHGFSFFAAELRSTAQFIGFIGIVHPDEVIGMPPGYLELGWRLSRAHWGKGLATEGATACMAYALNELGAPGVGAITAAGNAASINVMRKLGMEFGWEFMHPDIDAEAAVALHVLYLRTKE
jgi:ribosomal-protein-alanine N-acetyltransferase